MDKNDNSSVSDICECCQKSYQLGNMNFYKLCNPCFDQFDNQKMTRRFSNVFDEVNIQFYTESVKIFIENKKCTHTSVGNKMSQFIDQLGKENLSTKK
jgi:hypothetical protein